jgi:hypothetical protein
MVSLRVAISLSAALLVMPVTALADHLPLGSGASSQSTQITARRSAAVNSAWSAFLVPGGVGGAEVSTELPGTFSDLDAGAAGPWSGGVGGGVEYGLFNIVTTGHDVSFGLEGEDIDGSFPAWPVDPSGVRPIGGRIGPTTPATPGGGGEVVIVPLPAAAYMGMAMILGLGGASGVRKIVRRRPSALNPSSS